jgi:hypothetical protein
VGESEDGKFDSQRVTKGRSHAAKLARLR